MNKGNNIPVYQQLVQTVRTGFLALDDAVQTEIRAFIKSQQDNSGTFVDRARTPDLYYSLFGLWLSLATEQTKLQQNLKKYISTYNDPETQSPVEELAVLLIKMELDPNQQKQSILSLLKTVFKNGKLIELSYQFFLLSLVIDATGKNQKLYYFFARMWLFIYKPKGSIPCSLTAALVYARKTVGLRTHNLQNSLLNFVIKNSGFRAFESIKTSDTLSTSVALFVLKQSGYDLRILTPGCLNFVQKNYDSGAFLSGDGDNTKDLEYTFYGLLALGSLIEDER